MYFYMNITCILESICLDDKNYAVQHESSIFSLFPWKRLNINKKRNQFHMGLLKNATPQSVSAQ